MSEAGLHSCIFDLEDRNTWSHLDMSSFGSILITFALSGEKHLELLNSFLSCFKDRDVPLICLSTCSIFASKCHEDTLDENSTMTGLSVMGKPQTDRVEGERWVFDRKGAILHLSGI